MTLKTLLVCSVGWMGGVGSGIAGFFDDHARGWHWYEERKRPDKKVSEKLPEKPSLKEANPSAILKRFQKKLRERLHRALIFPSRDNILSYMRLQKIMMERAELFGARWMEVVFTHPQLDYTSSHPVNQVGLLMQAHIEKEEITRKIRSLSRSHGLFFFFSSACAYCHAFGPIVKSFSQKYGWKVMAISMDGSRLKEFPDAVQDNGTALKLGVKVLPTLLAVNPKTEAITPLSYGLSSHDQIEERVRVLVKGGSK